MDYRPLTMNVTMKFDRYCSSNESEAPINYGDHIYNTPNR